MQTQKQTPKKSVFAFGRTNFVLLAIGMAAVIIGMVLMSGSGSPVIPIVMVDFPDRPRWASRPLCRGERCRPW